MKAIYFDQTGDAASVLGIKEFDKPTPGPGQVVVKMLGSVINPADFFFIAGTYRFKPIFPQIAGLEGAGIIERVGEQVDLHPGVKVAFLSKSTWAEYVTVEPKDLLVLPADFPLHKAVQFALNPLTAWGLLEKADLKAGDWLVLTAGNSVVSQLTARIARLRQVNVIAIVRNGKYSGEFKKDGIEMIDVSTENLTERINLLTGGTGAAAVLDAVGGQTGTELLLNLQTNGKYIVYGRLDPAPVQFHNSTISYKNITISPFGIRGYLESKTTLQKSKIVKSLVAIIGEPDFNLPVKAAYQLTEYKNAVLAALDTTGSGKVIFEF